MVCIIALLASCSSAPKKKRVSTPNKVTERTETQSVDQLLEVALNTTDNKEKIAQLIIAGEFAHKQGNDQLTLFITSKLLAMPLSKSDKTKTTLLQAKSFFSLGEIESATHLVEKLSKQSVNTNDYWFLVSELSQYRHDNLAQLQAIFELPIEFFNSELDYAQTIWQSLINIPSWHLKFVKKIPHQDVRGWLALHALFSNNTLTAQDTQSWRLRFANHPANSLLATILPSDANIPAITNVAILLPLSGREESLGLIVQEGILSAYQNEQAFNLNFIDTNANDMNHIAGKLKELNAEFIVGPLLKKHVKSLTDLRRTPLANDNLDANLDAVNYLKQLPLLLLNSYDRNETENNVFSFSLRPEDEATQAADILSKKGYKKPLILSLNNAVGHRVADAFSEKWLALTHVDPIKVLYEDASKMQSVVESIMEVDDSKARFEALDRRINEKIYELSRNRRDIDMIYLFGNTIQTRLLKPFIDVNIAPFANTIPIYASSRSHSSEEDRNISQDLVGLTFTDMPWLLPSKQRNSELKATSDAIWPNRIDNLQRLYAMGFDSFHLINKIREMARNNLYQYQGQTGLLRLSPQGNVERELVWGTYQGKKVRTIAME